LRRGQDVGEGIWTVLAAVLPRAARIQVRLGAGSVGGYVRIRRLARGGLRPAGLEASLVTRASARWAGPGQVTSEGDVRVVSGMAGAKGVSWMTLSGGKGLGSDGAARLADVLQKAPPHMLAEMDLRCLAMPLRRLCVYACADCLRKGG
jgi:hypothetical protein